MSSRHFHNKMRRDESHFIDTRKLCLLFVPCRAPCRAVPCRAVPCRAVPCRAVPRRTAPYRAVPRRTAPYRAAPRRTAPYRAAPRRTAPHRAVPRRTAPYRAAPRRTAPYRAVPRRTAPRVGPRGAGLYKMCRAAWCLAAPYRAVPRRTAPYRAVPRRTAPRVGPRGAAWGRPVQDVPHRVVSRCDASGGKRPDSRGFHVHDPVRDHLVCPYRNTTWGLVIVVRRKYVYYVQISDMAQFQED